MATVDVCEPGVETKSAGALAHVSVDADGELTPKSKRKNSLTPPPAPRVRRGHGFAPVCLDAVEVYTADGERMPFNTEDITTGDLRFAVAVRRGVSPSQVQLLCGELEVSDDTPILSGHLSAAFRCAPEPVAFPQKLL